MASLGSLSGQLPELVSNLFGPVPPRAPFWGSLGRHRPFAKRSKTVNLKAPGPPIENPNSMVIDLRVQSPNQSGALGRCLMFAYFSQSRETPWGLCDAAGRSKLAWSSRLKRLGRMLAT